MSGIGGMGGEPPAGGNGGQDGKGEKPLLHPFQIILTAFEYFKAQTMDEDSLVAIAIANKCPNRDVALSILGGMVQQGLLMRREQDGKTLYTVVKKSDLDPRFVQ